MAKSEAELNGFCQAILSISHIVKDFWCQPSYPNSFLLMSDRPRSVLRLTDPYLHERMINESFKVLLFMARPSSAAIARPMQSWCVLPSNLAFWSSVLRKVKIESIILLW